MKITPALIPHTQFHTGSWLQSVERPGWYYFKKKKTRNDITNTAFAESVDEPLQRLVTYLHKKGIKTTPSCSGHNMGDRNFEKLYADLEEDCRHIKNGGLSLKDVETGEVYCYKDKHYALPWNKEHFLEQLEDYQHKGVIGLRPGRHRKIKEALLQLKLPGVKLKAEPGIVFIFTNEDKQSDIRNIWKKITDEIIALIEKVETA